MEKVCISKIDHKWVVGRFTAWVEVEDHLVENCDKGYTFTRLVEAVVSLSVGSLRSEGEGDLSVWFVDGYNAVDAGLNDVSRCMSSSFNL